MSGKPVIIEERLKAVLYAETHTLKKTAKEFHCSQRALSRWIALYKKTGSVADPPSMTGKKRKLEEQEEQQIVKLAKTHVGITNVALAKAGKNKITPRTVSNILKRAEENFETKLIQYDYPDTFTEEHYQTGKKFINNIKRISMHRRIYVDETWIGPAVRRKRARIPKSTVLQLPAPTGKKMTVISAICLAGSLNLTSFYPVNCMTTAQFEHWVKNKLAPCVQPGDTVLWDQLGKYGRERCPYRLHWSPKAIQSIEARGGKVIILPPKGKLFNPIELFFRDIKAKYISKLPQPKQHALAQKITPRQMKLYWHRAEKEIHSQRFEHYFKQRANGAEFIKVSAERGFC